MPRENEDGPRCRKGTKTALDAGRDQSGSDVDLRISAIDAVHSATLMNRSGCLQHASEKEASVDGWEES